MRESDLLGTWSEDVLHSPGAQSDYLLHFRGDGLGSVSYETGLSSELSVFTWSLAGGCLTITTIAAYLARGTSGDTFEPEPHDQRFDLDAAAFSITVEDTPVAGPVRVIRLRPGAHPGYPDAFGYLGDAAPPPEVTALLDRHGRAGDPEASSP
ncbi:MAG: hypothetical protein HY830_23715 [Actinobacteria bacterium]|nr:hypothetical protein [Actinomycetota bacterium]